MRGSLARHHTQRQWRGPENTGGELEEATVDSGMRSIVGGTVLLLLFSRGAIRAQDAFQLADGQVGTPYTYEIKTEGGLAPLHWSKVSGELPPGLTLRENTISGTPTLAQADPYEF